ncbi:MAG: hypothetical protein AB7L65_04155 [Hyphomonadaceae bacterium]
MSDISLHFTPWDIALIAVLLGWPGLLAGAAFGAWAWRKRRILGGALGAVAGCAALFAVRVMLL